LETLPGLAVMNQAIDPEANFIFGSWMAHLGMRDRALDALARAVRGGFYPADTLSRARVFEPLRDDPTFRELHQHAERGRDAAWVAFSNAGGERLLGLSADERPRPGGRPTLS
jgi:hypothetical protein